MILFVGPYIFDVQSSIGAEDIFDYNEQNFVHYTIFFNIFVYLQVFNEINSRKLKQEEKDVFEGFFNNPLFLYVLIGTILV